MRAKIGDVVIDRTYNKKGNLAIVVGEGISQPILIYHKGGITMDKLRDYFATWDGLEVIGHIDFEKVWEEAVRTADRKTEPQTDYGDFANRLAYERGVKHAWEVAQKVFDSTVTFYEAEDLAKQIDKTEPQTETKTETQNSNLTFKKRTMRDCYNCKRYETEGECIECHYEPKTEPQTDCTNCDQVGRCERGRAVECPMTERSE